jgi:hypothetical protein
LLLLFGQILKLEAFPGDKGGKLIDHLTLVWGWDRHSAAS